MAPTQNVSIEGAALFKFRTVDVFKDEGVWIVLDEGCNSRCRGKAWALDAGQKLENLAFYPTRARGQRKTCSG
eukprot:5281420-Pyramimonas_sp.AAC.1